MSDKTNPYREGMRAAEELKPERANPYKRGSREWVRWLGGWRAEVELAKQVAQRAKTAAAQEAQ